MPSKPTSQWRAGYATVKIVRFPWDPQEKPWGLVLDEGTLRFRDCAPGSIAADGPGLQSYIGKELASIDERAVRSLADVEKQFARCDRAPGRDNKGFARLCFRDPLPSRDP